MQHAIKNDTVKEKTGNTLDEWMRIIREEGRADAPHKEIAAFLFKNYPVSFWWAQEITVRFEKAVGRRVTGQTLDAGFQLGVSRTLPVNSDTLWNFLVSKPGFSLITGETKNITLSENTSGSGENGIIYRITTLHPFSHMRMKWQFDYWETPSILQIRVGNSGHTNGRSVLTIHQEKMKDGVVREKMKIYWKNVMKQIKAALAG